MVVVGGSTEAAGGAPLTAQAWPGPELDAAVALSQLAHSAPLPPAAASQPPPAGGKYLDLSRKPVTCSLSALGFRQTKCSQFTLC